MNIQAAINAKLGEVASFVITTAQDVMRAEVGEPERGVLAVQLLRLLVSVSPASFAPAPVPVVQPIAEVAPVPQEVVVQPVVEAPSIAAAVEQPAPSERKAQNGGRVVKFNDAMIADAVSKTSSVEAAAALLGCSDATIKKYRQRHGLSMVRSSPPVPEPKIEAGFVTFQPNSDGVRWNEENLTKLREMAMREPRPTIAALADAMGTTESAIQTALSRHGMSRRNRAISSLKPRDCMTCTKPFMSEGNHNRMCARCLNTNESVAA
ncbi:hypothetical protein FIU28_17440 [Tardiphaga sp. vice154]|uniref:hypothetical protein n=1 Tax=Tardiphaga sp. vice154 TaxID=2592814 RepID=UPI001161C9F1|nr:hypothetical protein [Tardiphaga sp. vice154]QDM22736.1 hypothetical protein FIU28_17440 [Tardiphaga sp. vice154]